MKTKIGTWRSTGVSVVLRLCIFGRFLVWRHGADLLAGGRADKLRWWWWYQVKRVKSTVGGVVQAGTVVMRERWEVGGGGGAAARSM